MDWNSDDYQIAALIGLTVLFSLFERRWPAHPVDRFRDLKLDVLSFVFALMVNASVTRLVRNTVGEITPLCLQSTVAALRGLPSAARVALALVVVDFVVYWIHRSQHRFELMWRTHAWHHSIEQMYWFAGFRTSFFHSLLNNVPQVVIPVTLFRLTPAELGVGYSIGVFIQFIEHTNWRLSFGPLDWLIVTPDYHRIHHAADMHRGKNLAGTFRLWDRMFGTFVEPATFREEYALGLGERVDGRRIPRMLVGV
jgi:sterol desaturase/sphingolipid hydroxylase (fatty acid hydroxylase superfamily)